MTQNTDRLISALEVAYRADLHPATIYRKALRGEIPGLVKLGKTVRFKESEIEKWLNGTLVISTRKAAEHTGRDNNGIR